MPPNKMRVAYATCTKIDEFKRGRDNSFMLGRRAKELENYSQGDFFRTKFYGLLFRF
jgi:hypothetical protein